MDVIVIMGCDIMKKKIKAIFIDCDGVLTTGSYFYSKEGKLLKEFSAMDGKGYAQAKKIGINILVITEEPDDKGFNITKKRCEDQRVELERAKDPKDKLRIAKEYAFKKGVTLEGCAFIADDIGDWLLFKEVGMPIAVANAYEKLKEFAKKKRGYVTKHHGGRGAVREAIEYIIKDYT